MISSVEILFEVSFIFLTWHKVSVEEAFFFFIFCYLEGREGGQDHENVKFLIIRMSFLLEAMLLHVGLSNSWGKPLPFCRCHPLHSAHRYRFISLWSDSNRSSFTVSSGEELLLSFSWAEHLKTRAFCQQFGCGSLIIYTVRVAGKCHLVTG